MTDKAPWEVLNNLANVVISAVPTRPPFALTGSGVDGSAITTEGYAFWFNHNSAGNNQLLFGSTRGFNNFLTGCFGFADFGAIASIRGITGDGVFPLPINLGSASTASGVAMGNTALAYNATLPAYCTIYGQATMIGFQINLGSSGTANLANFANNAGTAQSSIDSAGNFSTLVAGVGYKCKEGTNATMGTAVLVGGTLVVNTTKVTANSRIFLTPQVLGGIAAPVGVAVTARTAGTSFTITSASVLDTSTVAWFLIEPS